MDLRKLKTLIDLVSESNISELEITEAEGKVRIVKSEPPAAAPPMATMTYAPPPPAPTAVPAAPVVEAAPVAEAPSGHVVKSPMVGTFYRASSPGSPPIVDIGSQVNEGDALCIIEAMKIMNEIEADQAGTIKQVLVDNGQAVEYGQPLFVIG